MNYVEYSVYCNREDVKFTENEQKNIFIRTIINNIGIDIDEVWENGSELDPEKKLALFRLLEKYDIQIIDDGDRGYKIYVDDSCIGEWFKPRVQHRVDPRALKLSSKLYAEIKFKTGSLFTEEDEDG